MARKWYLLIWAIFIIAPVISNTEYVWSEPYKCSCSFETTRWSDPFSEILSKLQCCVGKADCSRSTVVTNPDDRDLLLCFSDMSCIYDPRTEVSSFNSCSNDSSKCSSEDMVTYNVSNILKEWSIYKCVSVKKDGYPLCLLPVCKSFAAVEKNCLCNRMIRNCTCYTGSLSEDLILGNVSETYALFLSFADTYNIVQNTTFPTVKVLVGFFSVLLSVALLLFVCKCVRILLLRSSSDQSTNLLQEICIRFCRLRTQNSNSTESTVPHAVHTPKELRPDPRREADHALPSYDEAVRNERPIHTIELPPTYTDIA